MKTCDQLQTMAVAYAEICRGEYPWIALGNFMNDWFDVKEPHQQTRWSRDSMQDHDQMLQRHWVTVGTS